MSRRGVFFARKFSVERNKEVIDMIDSYIHNNQSTDAGLNWPGFYEVDMATIGRYWVQAYNRNRTEKETKRKKAKKIRLRSVKGSSLRVVSAD